MSVAKKLIIAAAVIFVLGVVGSVGGIVGVFWWYGRGVADLDGEQLRNYRPPQVTNIYSRDGQLIGELFEQRRVFVHYRDIPTHVENAFLAAEDADFYKHEGMDYTGMVRALVANVKAGEIRQGASTITQQVIKIFVLSPERTFERKVQELILARRLEQAFTKTQILELYLNEIFLGHGRYGIEAASRYYFGKGVAEINLGQAALLATLPKAPGRDSPISHPARAKSRQVYVLEQMVKHGFATQDEAQGFIDADLASQLAPEQERTEVVAGAEEFVDAVKRQLREHYGDQLKTLGARVTTTVSLGLQAKARAAVVDGLKTVDARKSYGREIGPAGQGERDAVLASSKALKAGAVVPALIEGRPDGAKLPDQGFAAHVGDHDVFVRVPDGSRYHDPKRSLGEQYPAGGVVDVRIVRGPAADERAGLPPGWADAEVAAGPEGVVIVADVGTGEVLAMVGGSSYGRAQLNRAMYARRSPGSTFKPFVYGAALLTKQFTAATIVSDSPGVYGDYKPTNYMRDKYDGDIRLRVALTKSKNTVAIKLVDQLGVAAVADFARAAGIESELPDGESMGLGTGEVTPYELMRSYLTLARGGDRVEPRIILKVEPADGDVWEPQPETERTIPQDVVFVLTSMMQSVVERGTGTGAKKLGRPTAGKTGTSSKFRDAWFAGFTPRRVAVAWVGFDSPREMTGETGGKTAIPIWLAAMRAAEKGDPIEFDPPPSVTTRRIDAASGLLVPTGSDASSYSGKSLTEYFLQGTEPIEEAVPAALPRGDVLLDLYDDAANEPAPPSEPDPPARKRPGDELPSLDDESLR